LADFVSFVVVRYHARRWSGQPVEIDPASLGRVQYLGFERRDDMLYTWEQVRGEFNACIRTA
jgi:hypothetical protein